MEDLDQFLAWKDGVIRPEGESGYDRRHEATAPAAQQIYDYFERAIDDHIASPRDDVLSSLIAARVEGEPLTRHEILDIVGALPEDVTVLLIEHDMDIVFSFADRISVLVNGALFVDGAPDEVARDPRVKAVYLGESLDA